MLKFFVQKSWAWGQVHIRVFQPTGHNRVVVAEPLVMKEVTRKEGEMWPDSFPTLALSPEDAQALADELGKAGFIYGKKPENESNINAHLQDMRAIVFKKLGVDKP